MKQMGMVFYSAFIFRLVYLSLACGQGPCTTLLTSAIHESTGQCIRGSRFSTSTHFSSELLKSGQTNAIGILDISSQLLSTIADVRPNFSVLNYFAYAHAHILSDKYTRAHACFADARASALCGISSYKQQPLAQHLLL